jgi:UDPglucose 6-dehydrogenase
MRARPCAILKRFKLADAIGHDRIGRKFLNAGLGFGGGCLPKDIRAFMARASELGADEALDFLREIDAINVRRRSRTVDLAREQCGGTLVGRRVAAFKPDSDDIRDSPALDVAQAACREGSVVSVYDPKATEAASGPIPTSGTPTPSRVLAGRRRRAAPDRVEAVPRDRPGQACGGRGEPHHHRRP